MSIKRMMGVAVLSLAAVAPLALAQDKTKACFVYVGPRAAEARRRRSSRATGLAT